MQLKNSSRSAIASCLLAVCGLAVLRPCQAATNDESQHAPSTAMHSIASGPHSSDRAIRVRMLINASPVHVWHAICDQKDDDPDVKYSKITQLTDTERLLEQKYGSLPFLGTTTCVLHIAEDPCKRIDYKLVRSDSLSDFAGTWILTPMDDGSATLIEVSNQLRLKFPLPQKIVDTFAKHKLKSRVALVKNIAEASQSKLLHAAELTRL